MNKFKVGDEVTLKEDISSIYLKHNKEYVVDKVFDDKLFVQGVDFKYDSKIFELVKESNMNKFKVGDKVVRVSETYGKAIKGGVYEVSGVSDDEWADSCGINLKGHEGVSCMFNYDASCFELYVDGILSPLEAAEAMLKDKDIEFLSEVIGEWRRVGRPYSQQCLKRLTKSKLRLKPKTIIINGVTVLAPLTRKPNQEFIYFINFFKSRVYQLPTENLTFNHKYYWATKEDAQQALDAMLIPFNNLNKGDK